MRFVVIGLLLGLMAASGNFIVCAHPLAEGLPPVRDGDGRFGLCFIEPEEPWLSLAYDAGARVNRWQINWRDVEHEEGNFYYGWYDPQIRAMRDRGFEISAILTYPPDWATEEGSVVPRNLYLPYDDLANYWGRFVRKVVERYRGRIASWEIWNEPDLDIYWDGTAKDYYQLLKVAYQAAKAADPACRVVMGGMGHWEDPRFFERVVRLAVRDPEASAHNYFFDAVAWHWYSRPSLLYDKALWCRQVLAKYGLTKPIWVNETNVPLWGDWPGPETRQPDHATPDEQASFIIQAYANAIAANVERVFVFRLHDAQMARGQAYGLVRNDGSPRPAYHAYRVAATFFSHVVTATRQISGSITTVTMRKAHRGRVTVLWNNSPTPVTTTVAATAPAALLVDKVGRVERRRPVGGSYTITLPGAAEEGAIGGSPYILVEADDAPPTSQVEPLPALMPDLAFPVRWSGEDDPLGLGLASYDVQVRDGDGPWRDWLVETTDTEATFVGREGHSYAFRCRARDLMGNLEPYPPDDQPDALTSLTGVLSGRVLDIRDVPVVGATVRVDGGPSATTDRQGRFRITGLVSGTIDVEVTKAGFGPLPIQVRVQRGREQTCEWHLPPLGDRVINGRFEWGLGGWTALQPRLAAVAVASDEAGDNHVQLRHQNLAWGSVRLRQSLHIPSPLRHPTLSFRYRKLDSHSLFEVRIRAPSGWATLFAAREPTDWRHVWLDVGRYRGQSVAIEFGLRGEREWSPAAVHLDDVCLGSVSSTRLYFPLVHK